MRVSSRVKPSAQRRQNRHGKEGGHGQKKNASVKKGRQNAARKLAHKYESPHQADYTAF